MAYIRGGARAKESGRQRLAREKDESVFLSLLVSHRSFEKNSTSTSLFQKNETIGAVVQKRPWHASVLAFLLAVINALKGFLSTIFCPDAAANYKKKGSGGSGGLGLGGGGGGGGGHGGGGSGGPGSRPRVGGMASLRSVNPPAGGGCCGGGGCG